MYRVLFVCLGNICRSPMAQAIFANKVRESNLDAKFQIDSCGTAAYHLGEPPDPRTIDVLEENGIGIDHAGRQLTSGDFYKFDYILAMDRSNLNDILYMKPQDSQAAVMLFRDFDPLPGDREVPDPYYGGNSGFQNVFEMLNRTSDAFLAHVLGR